MAPWPEGRRKEDEFDRTDVQRNGSQTGVCTQITQRDNLTSVVSIGLTSRVSDPTDLDKIQN